MPRFFLIIAALALLNALGGQSTVAEVTFEWVTIDNPGNIEDQLNSGNFPGIGSVAYKYNIARYEVTNSQYVEFLNAVASTDTNNLFSSDMETHPRAGITQNGQVAPFTYVVRANMGNKPVNFVSFLDAMRFVNWLHNGQPTGAQDSTTTEDGVYTVSDGISETRAPNATIFIPTTNEWYKAAYHQPFVDGGDTDDYWLYATRSNDSPFGATANATGDISNPGFNVVNYANTADWEGQNGNVTSVGTAGTDSYSYYGTADQSGNLNEWNEDLLIGVNRIHRGGYFSTTFLDDIKSTVVAADQPHIEGDFIGFRVARFSTYSIPTVSEWGASIMLLLLASVGTIVFKRLPEETTAI